MLREWLFYIDDMIMFSEKVLSYTENLVQIEFEANSLIYDATLRNLELIGEAATHRPHFVGREKIMKAIVIGIMSQEDIRKRVLAIARGEYKPKANEPKIWFTSMKSLAEVLSDENRALLKVITKTKPTSITALAAITGRKPSNLSRTLKTMSNYGIVDLQHEKNQVRPVVRATEFRIVTA